MGIDLTQEIACSIKRVEVFIEKGICIFHKDGGGMVECETSIALLFELRKLLLTIPGVKKVAETVAEVE